MAETLLVDEPQGASPHAVDDTGRVTLRKQEAKNIREALGIPDKQAFNLIVAQDVDDCLLVFTTDQWSTFADSIMALSSLDPDARDLRRIHLGAAEVVTVDRQDRMKLSSGLLAWANLRPSESYATLVNVGDCYELWEVSAYREYIRGRREQLKAFKRRLWGTTSGREEEADQ